MDNTFFSRLGAHTTRFKPLQRIDTLNIAPTENDQFLRNQILIGFPHDEAAAFMGGVSGNAGLFSSANDLAKLLQMILNNGSYGNEQFINKETCQLFTRTKSPNGRWGLGFDKPATNDKEVNPCGKLTPASAYGHTGYTGTCFWIDPDNQLIFIFLSNRVYPSRTNKEITKLEVRSKIQDAIYEALK
jgi:CubicO group peptidase (beta-lactamase class C family)